MFIQTQNNMQNQQTDTHSQVHDESLHHGKGPKKGGKKWGSFFFGLILVAGITYGGYWWYQNSTNPKATTFSFYDDKYHGVFLENGDVYFGKLSNKEGTFVVLKDAYYLRVTEQLQNTKEGKQVKVPDLKLVKIGLEFHKPTDAIELERSHILFIQELQPDSEVIKVINDYKNSTRQ